MAYKNALAGLDHGGGKAVIIGDPAVDKSEALLLAYGRFLDVSAAATSPPATSAPTWPTWTWWPGPPGSRPAARRGTAAPGTPRSSRRTACSRACGPAPSTCGARRRWPAGPSASPGSARWAGTWSTTCSTDGATVVVTDVSAAAVDARTPDAPGRRGGRRHRRAGARRPRRLLALRPRARADRRGRRRTVAPGWSAAAPTTSWPTPASRSCWPTAASSTPPTTASTPAG